MQTLILVLSFLMQHGVTLQSITIETVAESDTEYNCHGFIDSEGTILACIEERKILIIPRKL
jgi:hypothetical protein